MVKLHLSSAILAAVSAAILFGASIPFAKQLVGEIPPILLAGLLYLGSGIGLMFMRLLFNKSRRLPQLNKKEWLCLFAAICCGGVVAPILLMLGLKQINASAASLLLNFEAVLTAVLAWIIFKEHTDRRIILGMFLIVVGGVLLTWSGEWTIQNNWSVLLIIGACLAWAFDNNLTRKVASADALFIAGSKGLIAGIVNVSLSLALGLTLPSYANITSALLIGLLGYGISLVLFVLALRGLGTARTGAYFSTAPFMGALIAVLFFHEPTTLLFWLAAVLMASGVWLHLAETHEHLHTHEALFHTHHHVHDEHHQHTHDFPWNGEEPHTHPHQHAEITHSHHHYPDIHHRHKHK